MTDPVLRSAFLTTSYGTAQQRTFLNQQRQDFCPTWATATGYAILTAHNPNGLLSSTAHNAQAQACLVADLSAYTIPSGSRYSSTIYTGYNGEGQWREETCIVQGLSLGAALELGRKYQQAAVIWGVGQRAALVWCQSGAVERLWWGPA